MDLTKYRPFIIAGLIGAAGAGILISTCDRGETTKTTDQVVDTTKKVDMQQHAQANQQTATESHATDTSTISRDKDRSKHREGTTVTVIEPSGKKTITEHFFEDDVLSVDTIIKKNIAADQAAKTAAQQTVDTTVHQAEATHVETHTTETTKPASHLSVTGMAGLDLRQAVKGSVSSWYGAELDLRLLRPLSLGVGATTKGDASVVATVDLTTRLSVGVTASVAIKEAVSLKLKPTFGGAASYRVIGPVGVGVSANLSGDISGYIGLTLP